MFVLEVVCNRPQLLPGEFGDLEIRPSCQEGAGVAAGAAMGSEGPPAATRPEVTADAGEADDGNDGEGAEDEAPEGRRRSPYARGRYLSSLALELSARRV